MIPSSLDDITLRQKIDYQQKIGDELDAKAKEIFDIQDEVLREIEIVNFQIEKMFKSFAYFANCTIESLQQSEFVSKIANIYYVSIGLLFEEEAAIDLKQEFTWNDEVWKLAAPELTHGDQTTFGEFIDSKQIVQDMAKLGRSRWEALIPLSAVFLRKEDEPYDKSFLYEGSERLKLMETLPLSIALQVGFFLSTSLNMFTLHSPSFNHHVSKMRAGM